jgi:hypothetical protein
VLDVPVSFFFDGLVSEPSASAYKSKGRSASPLAGQVSVDEVGELLRLYSSITDHEIRRSAIEYVRSLLPSGRKSRQG